MATKEFTIDGHDLTIKTPTVRDSMDRETIASKLGAGSDRALGNIYYVYARICTQTTKANGFSDKLANAADDAGAIKRKFDQFAELEEVFVDAWFEAVWEMRGALRDGPLAATPSPAS